MGNWIKVSEHDGPYLWRCASCGRVSLSCRAYPSPRASCPICGARDAGPVQVDVGVPVEVHVQEWRDGDGASVHYDGQAIGLPWAAWDEVLGRLADLRRAGLVEVE